MAHEQSGGIPGWVEVGCPTIKAAIDELVKFRAKKAMHLMVNKLPASCLCPVHTDNVVGSPERWHLPLVTNPNTYWWDEKEGLLHMDAGNWYGPMPYGGRHTVVNFGTDERIHLIVDVEK